MLPALILIVVAAVVTSLIKSVKTASIAPVPTVKTFSKDEFMLVLLKEKKLTLQEARFVMDLTKEMAMELSVHAWDPGSVKQLEAFMTDTVKVDAGYAAAFHSL